MGGFKDKQLDNSFNNIQRKVSGRRFSSKIPINEGYLERSRTYSSLLEKSEIETNHVQTRSVDPKHELHNTKEYFCSNSDTKLRKGCESSPSKKSLCSGTKLKQSSNASLSSPAHAECLSKIDDVGVIIRSSVSDTPSKGGNTSLNDSQKKRLPPQYPGPPGSKRQSSYSSGTYTKNEKHNF